ncbi:MAG: Glu-tRNA(Gln) amidotransferase subunit GatE [Nanoarchaeota archaeon]|nr:Glu-tRNA(Gln) amidotransferase subunit GatE [Nanoarchaeota archaeon]
MTIDYAGIGLKSGLEIHQQLDSHKLYCNCPFLLRQDDPDFTITRKLHAVAGEAGEVDVAAAHEAGLDKEFVYQGYDTTCLVELDEEPPHEINKMALKIALHISLLLNCKIVPLSQIMRKTVIDGSNTSGFQRTVLIARDGYVETSKGKVGIWFLYLEEDAARTVSEDKNRKTYRLDRLGGPMVEVVTAPDIKDAEHAKETALKIGEILRSASVKRGIGTIRQDINISIAGHPRAEIKGFQDPKIFVDVVNKEIERQIEEIKSGKELVPEVRGANDDGSTKFLRPLPGSARMYPETDLPLLKISKEMINEAKKTLPRLRSEVEPELRKEGLDDQFIDLLFKQGKVGLYRELYYLLPKGNFIAKMILLFPKEFATKKKMDVEEVEKILEDNYASVLNLLVKKKIKESHIKEILGRLVEGVGLEEAIKFESVDVADLEEEIHKIIKSKPGLNANAYMGLVMKDLKGKIGGKEAMEIIKKLMK